METSTKQILGTVILISTLLIGNVAFGQSSKEKEKARLQAEIDRLNAEIAKYSNTADENGNDTACYSETTVTNLGEKSEAEFESYCTTWLSQARTMPRTPDTKVIASCSKTGNRVEAKICIIEPKSSFLRAESDIDQMERWERNVKAAKEKELKKVQGTIQYYRNLIDALDKELKRNGVEVVAASADLVVKHVENGGEILDEIKDAYVEEAQKRGYSLIENETANALNERIEFVESVLSHVKGGDKVTNHYLWRIFKSTPELGKMIGNGAASINIYFQRNEAKKHLEEVLAREKELQQQLRQE